MKVPCKGCEDRYGGCHDRCPLYKDYREQLEKINKSRREESNYLGYIAETMNRKRANSMDTYVRWDYKTRRG